MQIGSICIFILCIGVILGCQAFWNYKKLHRQMDPVNEFLKANYRENKAWPYSEVELGFPSELDHLIDIYAEDPGTTETVYGYVSIKVVNKLIKKHGGIIN